MEKCAKRRRICDYYGATTGPSCSHGMATSPGYDYEVFLSFRGSDTRSGFTDFLYTSLVSAGIRTFKDDEELRVGEEFAPELLQAIDQSKISIPIFSKGYASSVWCLKEVAQMVKCQKTGRQTIMPIFYDVAPSEVRHQTGGYGDAFRSHEKKGRYDEKTMQGWKDALSAVGDINGWDLHSQGENRREGDFAETIRQKVFKELKKASLAVSDCLVDVDDQVVKIMKMIGAWTSETRIIGIHGMGGIGKTTIAKIIYNQLSEKFDNCCFLSNVREVSKTEGIVHLQRQLISDILKTERTTIRNSEEGTQTIKDRLSKKKVLILLDDVDHKKDINALIGNHDWLGEGSKLIITTRNKEVLKVHGVEDLYEVNFMDSEQSLQLFSRHAFRRDYPLDEYINQSKRAVRIAGGLPLALETMGSLLACTAKEMWGVKLDKLEDVPRQDVQSRLRISYDALEYPEKNIFLDIACFFIGYGKDTMVSFWESKFHPEDAMDVLENMSLIKIKDDSKVWMHDQLRDLGRQIICKESEMKIEKQSRVWNTEEALDLLRRKKGENVVEALRLNLDDHQQRCYFTYEDFESLSNLRFLEVNGSEENFRAEDRLLWHESPSNGIEKSVLVPKLRWLSWRDIPPKFNIADFSMRDVVILNLSESEITHQWKGWSHMKVMKKLKVLNLSSCHRLQRLPDGLCRGFASLEYLSLKECTSLKRLPNSIGELASLIELDISGTSIEELPDSIGKLRNLKVVKMRSSDIREIPDALWTNGKLERVEASRRDEHLHGNIGNGIYENKSLSILKLDWGHIYKLPKLPESLTILHLNKLRMETFPDLSSLTNLKELELRFDINGDGGKSNGLVEDWIPRWIVNLTKLESLRLDSGFVATVSTDLSLPPHLKSLQLYCPNLDRLPRLSSSVSSLHLRQCKSLRSIGDLSNLKNLSSLHLAGCDSLCSMNLSGLKKLSSLEISSSEIAEIQGLGCLENLRELHLHGINQVKVLPDLRNSYKLRSLEVSHCGNLVEIEGKLPLSLDRLRIDNCHSLVKLPDLLSFRGKHVAHIGNCEKLPVDAILAAARKYPGELCLKGAQQLASLPDLSNLTDSSEITSLQVRSCGNLVEIRGKLPEHVEKLEIDDCNSLWELPDLSSSMKLREVCIERCDDLFEIKGELPQSLEIVKISNKSLQKLPDLSSLTRLREISIRKCVNLVEIQGKLPQSLEKWKIYSCESLRELPNLSSLMQLQEVCIGNCGNLVKIQGELPQSLKILEISSCKSLVEIQGKLPESLEKMKICWCGSLQKLPDLSSSMKLREVCIDCCDHLVQIQGKVPVSLEKLDIFSCESFQKLPSMSRFMKLREVSIRSCGKLVKIQGELPRSLEKLKIRFCGFLEELPNMSTCMELREVSIGECGKLVEIQGELPQSLEKLEIHSCGSLQKLPNMSRFMELREVSVGECGNLVEIQGELPQSLENLEIRSCGSLQKSPNISSLTKLREVSIVECGNLVEIQGELPQSLEKLRISFEYQKLPDLSRLMGLREVCIADCGDLVEIQGKLPKSLEKLRISCVSQKLPNLLSLTGLRDVSIVACGDLVEIQDELPQSLERLEIQSCGSLQKLPILSSLQDLRMVVINGCKKLNVKEISLHCLENSVKLVKDEEYEWDKRRGRRGRI